MFDGWEMYDAQEIQHFWRITHLCKKFALLQSMELFDIISTSILNNIKRDVFKIKMFFNEFTIFLHMNELKFVLF